MPHSAVHYWEKMAEAAGSEEEKAYFRRRLKRDMLQRTITLGAAFAVLIYACARIRWEWLP